MMYLSNTPFDLSNEPLHAYNGRLLPGNIGRDERVVFRALVEVRQEPIVQLDGAPTGTGFDPASRSGQQRLPGFGDGLADRGAADKLAIEAVEQQPRGLDVDGMAHREHAAHARLDQARCDGAEDGGFPHVALRLASSTTSGML